MALRSVRKHYGKVFCTDVFYQVVLFSTIDNSLCFRTSNLANLIHKDLSVIARTKSNKTGRHCPYKKVNETTKNTSFCPNFKSTGETSCMHWMGSFVFSLVVNCGMTQDTLYYHNNEMPYTLQVLPASYF